jgi:hypothetical protein
MKTPREVLLERHRQAGPELDRIRRETLAQLAGPTAGQVSATPRSPILAALQRAWMELIWPSRQAWTGLAVLWLIVTAANLEMKTTLPSAPGARPAAVRELAQGLQEQRRLLSELLQTPKTPLAEPSRATPRPRSERQLNLKAC